MKQEKSVPGKTLPLSEQVSRDSHQAISPDERGLVCVGMLAAALSHRQSHLCSSRFPSHPDLLSSLKCLGHKAAATTCPACICGQGCLDRETRSGSQPVVLGRSVHCFALPSRSKGRVKVPDPASRKQKGHHLTQKGCLPWGYHKPVVALFKADFRNETSSHCPGCLSASLLWLQSNGANLV